MSLTAKVIFITDYVSNKAAKAGGILNDQAGKEFQRMCQQVGFDLKQANILSIFPEPPPRGSYNQWTGKKSTMPKGYNWPMLAQGKYLNPSHTLHVEKIWETLNTLKPNLVVPLGKEATWAILGTHKINSFRGTVCESENITSKIIPMYHFRTVLKQWELRPICLMDLKKIQREMLFSEINRPFREIWIEPTLKNIQDFFFKFLKPADRIAYDIETRGGEISCISFAPSKDKALVIPFTDLREKETHSYWPSLQEELAAWSWIKRILALPCQKVTQNGAYDMQWLYQKYGVFINGEPEDTMLMHHSLYPEMQKSLGFLGSVYTDEAAWKILRGKSQTTKQDDE